MNVNQELWASFWCGVLHKLIHEELSLKERQEEFCALSKKEYKCPNGKIRTYSESTLRRRLKGFEKNRLQGLLRKGRSDKNNSRKISTEVIETLIELKKDLPTRSAEVLNHMLRERTGHTIARSTLYRHLKIAGATRLKLGVLGKKIRKRWTSDHVHDTWVGDFSEGVFVLHNGEIVQTHLSAFIDAHSRYVIVGRYYLRQNLAVLEDSLLRALAVHGAPLAIYLDNAKVYRSRAYRLMCAEFGIKAIYRTPRDPAGGGLIERFIKTVQDQFESEARPQEIMSLEELNKKFSAWLDIAYHDHIHSEIGQTPRDRLMSRKGPIRRVELNRVSGFFMSREERTVNHIYSDVSLDNRRYRVDAKYRGDRVEVHFDPFSDLGKVHIFDLDGNELCEGIFWEREIDRSDESKPEVQKKPKHSLLDDLSAKQKRNLSQSYEDIDYRKALSTRSFNFTPFVTALAKGMKLKGELSAFDAGSLEILRNFWNTHANLLPKDLQLVFTLSESTDLATILFRLQLILKES
jgi:transposase InsO family protein